MTATHRWYRSGDRIVVVLDASVDYIFAKAVPGGPPRTTVHARADARLQDAPP